ncbi:hypothetical protein [uncultured Bacteroides sp.]|uniref:hypothetical protein n=1 Tax=uncultured Bacteroides sp. TaxID=162156 RepID=UPI002634E760|nr:hypothetical protein [uncultured Bacteroides sp.]
MKNSILNKLTVCVLILLTAFTSCDTDVEGVIYTPDETACYSFASSQINVELTADNQGVLKVPVYRGATNGNASLALTVDMDEATAAVFSLTSSEVAFANGEGVAYVELNFGSIDNLGATTKYTITLSIPEANQSPSAEGSVKVQAQRQLTWENFGTGVYSSQLFGQSWPQPIEKAVEGNVYRLPDCIIEDYPIVFTLSEDGQELVGWDIQPTGYEDPDYGMVYYLAEGMTRNGNILSFPMIGAVVYNGSYAALYSGFTETLEMPE